MKEPKAFLFTDGPETMYDWHKEVHHHGALPVYFDHCFMAGRDPELWLDEDTKIVLHNEPDHLVLTFCRDEEAFTIKVPWKHPPPPDDMVLLNSGMPSPPHLMFVYHLGDLLPSVRHMAMHAGHDPEFLWVNRDGESR